MRAALLRQLSTQLRELGYTEGSNPTCDGTPSFPTLVETPSHVKPDNNGIRRSVQLWLHGHELC